MTLSRQQSVFTFNSSSGGVTYYFDIVVDAQGLITVRNIRSSSGTVDCSSGVPDALVDDITTAKTLVVQLVGETQADSGTVVFTGQTSRPVVIPPGALNNTNYRVVYTTVDGTVLTTENKTTVGFDAVTGFPYGTVLIPKTVAYVVLVKTQQASLTGGELTFTPADAGQKTVTFNPAFTTADYRVILSPQGFFPAGVISQTKAGFTVELGFTLPVGDTAVVGYDVFVS